MNIRFTTFLIGLSVLLGASSTHAIFYRIDEWIKETPQGKKYLYCFSDLHCDKGNQAITYKQQAAIIDTALARKAHVIVEDMDMVDDGRNILQASWNTDIEFNNACLNDFKIHLPNFVINATPLRGLTKSCNDRQIPCCNVEFRQYLHNEHSIPIKFAVIEQPKYREIVETHRKTYAMRKQLTTIADEGKVLKKIYEEITEYNDRGLKEYYAAIMNDKNNVVVQALLEETCKSTALCSPGIFFNIIKTCFEKITKEKFSRDIGINGIDRLTAKYEGLFGSWIEVRMIHRVAQSDAEIIFLCGGGEHINKISQENYEKRFIEPSPLGAIGYKLNRSIGKMIYHVDSEKGVINYIEHDAIDIAKCFEEFKVNKVDPKPNPVVQPKRFPYFTIFTAAAAVAVTLSYLGYRLYKYKFAIS